MNKRTLAAIVAAVGIAGGALAVSQVDSSRFRNASESLIYFRDVDMGRTVSRAELMTALSDAASDRSWNINFKKVYEKGYKLGSVKETSNYQWTKANLPIGPMRGLELTISGFSPADANLTVRPLGFVSDEEIRQYLDRLSHHLQKE